MPDRPANDAEHRIIRDVVFGEGVVVHSFTNLYGCRIGDDQLEAVGAALHEFFEVG